MTDNQGSKTFSYLNSDFGAYFNDCGVLGGEIKVHHSYFIPDRSEEEVVEQGIVRVSYERR